MVNIYLLENFNNYYNREIKHYETIEEYTDKAAVAYLRTEQAFKLNDGISATYIWNLPEGETCSFVDYLVVVQDNEIATRWFVLEQHKTRDGQYSLILRRDLIADFLEPFKNSTIYLEKGYINSPSNYLIYNQEQFSANQIKKEEYVLRDELGLKWIVGYWNKGAIGTTTKTYTSHQNDLLSPDYIISAAQKAQISAFNGKASPSSFQLSIIAESTSPYSLYDDFRITFENGTGSGVQIDDIPNPRFTSYGGDGGIIKASSWSNIEEKTVLTYMSEKGITRKKWEEMLDRNNLIFYVSEEQLFYRLKVSMNPNDFPYGAIIENVATNLPLYSTLLEEIQTSNVRVKQGTTPSNNDFHIKIAGSLALKVEWERIGNESYNVTIDPTKMIQTVNESYNVFAIPVLERSQYFELTQDAGGTGGSFTVGSYNSAFAIAEELLQEEGVAIDLQLLPFCPLPRSMISGTTIKLKASEYGVVWKDIYLPNNNPANVIFFLDRTDFSFQIPFTDTNDYSTPEKVKEINQLRKYRICAGDYSSAFEFNPAKNGGISFFEVDCKYKPFAPYIHVAPNFGGLYGSDFNDTRGLVCANTNYSISRGTNAWETYERNNLNYNNAFRRQIENMDVQRNVQRSQEVMQAIVGGIQGSATGGLIGSAGGGWGIAAGVIGGGALSGVAGALDVKMSDYLYKENKQYAIDQFNMSLANIQALPNTLVATGAQNPNNKVFPVLEIYDCGEVEKEAFRQKLKWNGMTIGVITNKLTDYLKSGEKTYIKGQLIYIDDTFNPMKASEIANELAKGLLITGGNI